MSFKWEMNTNIDIKYLEEYILKNNKEGDILINQFGINGIAESDNFFQITFYDTLEMESISKIKLNQFIREYKLNEIL